MELEESWSEQKRRLKRKFSGLFENDCLFTESSKEELIAKLQKKLGKTKAEILNLLSK